MRDDLDELIQLAKRAHESLTESLDVARVEPTFEQIVVLLEANEHQRKRIINAFLELLATDSVPGELIEYWAHVLRWPELKEALENIVATTTSNRARFFVSGLLRAFDDGWDGRDLYVRWNSRPRE